MSQLCTTFDEFIEDKPIWIVKLSNGETIYQDDYRPYIYPQSAWLRLSNFIKVNPGIKIVELYLKFRSHYESPLEKNEDGYFFSKKASTTWDSPITTGSYLIGYLKNEVVKIQEWKVPELLYKGGFNRTIEKSGECLIYGQQVGVR